MSTVKGNLSINSENIFPIIKKWLYSDHDIFFRELISNGCDAITKLKKLDMIGEAKLDDEEELKVKIVVNPEEKTISFADNGIGMTADEVQEYINQIAFSGAQDFLEKYKDKANEDQIIGHFGLGFYSAFMVADRVAIDTLSYQDGATAVHWESDGGMEFEMGDGERDGRGTTVTLYLNEDSYEFSNEYRAKEVIEKYCSFMPIPIYFENANKPAEEEKEEEDEEETTDTKDGKEGKESGEETSSDGEKAPAKKKGPKPLNETTPLWTKHPNDCTEEEYKKFYRDVFMDYKEPLFWIHLNMDYPFNLKGILYFPKLNTEYDSIEGKIKLYSNQVFIADNIKEVIPEFLMLLKGVIDCPDLPLNVSRSALQNDGFVKKISDYITKKVADKLTGMYKVERAEYEKFWDDISPFIKFGCLKDDKFREKIKDYIIFKNLEGKYLTLPEYLAAAKGETADAGKAGENAGAAENDAAAGNDTTAEENGADSTAAGTASAVDENGEKIEAEVVDETKEDDGADSEDDGKEPKKDTVYYVTDEKQQSQYINMFKENHIDALIMTHNIDQPFITQLEYENQKVHFQRIDAELTDSFTDAEDEVGKKLSKDLSKLFKKVLNKEKLEVKVEKLKSEKVSAMITLSEESRRMQDMMRMYSMGGKENTDLFDGGQTLVLNANHPLVKYLGENKNSENATLLCEQLYDLAMLAHRPLEPEAMTKFVERSNQIMLMLTK